MNHESQPIKSNPGSVSGIVSGNAAKLSKQNM